MKIEVMLRVQYMKADEELKRSVRKTMVVDKILGTEDTKRLAFYQGPQVVETILAVDLISVTMTSTETRN